MRPKQIERFFEILAQQLDAPATVYLTGACAAALWGGVRPSQDIDFGLELGRGSTKSWQDVYAAVAATTLLTAMPASVAEDIDRWGMITLLDYKKTSRTYRRFGQLDVRLLNPTNWSIGKITRFLDPDITDVIAVFRRKRVSALAAARLWGRALRTSPPSTSQFLFRSHVEQFFAQHGKAIWGKAFDASVATRAFHKAAEIKVGRATPLSPF